ncbi:MAG: Na/Pi cotransporter family protein [Ruminococcus sp.]|jgi:phosphate:Na+ symporter
MDLFDVLTMLGGLALFLYGMSVMGDSLAKLSGGRLEKTLEKLTSNPIKAVLLGAAVTAVIQSSSATTVMVVGFVNSGIMKLSQAVGIIMGANIGTTVTSWILSLSGIEGGNMVTQLLKPSSFAPILAVIGIALMMFGRDQKKKNIATILLGFTVLMFGMDTMSNAVKPLADVPEFTGILTMFSNPILGVLAGAVLTAVIQSSSASIGILQALCVTGSVTYGAAIPIIMGQNIGTCVTAMLSSIGASKNARRAALVHLYFNLIGTAVFMTLFYLCNGLLHFSFLQDAANAAGIAVVHSVFNVFATAVLLPFSKGLEKLAYLTIKEDEKQETAPEETSDLLHLDARFLDQPGFAMIQCKRVAVHMAQMSQRALETAISLMEDYQEEKVREVLLLEDQVDHYEDQLGTYLVKLSGKNLSVKDSHTLSMLLHSIGDFERISDHAVNIMEGAQKMHDKQLAFSNKASKELRTFTGAIREIVNTAVEVFQNEDSHLAQYIEPLEEVIDGLQEELKKRHIKRLRNGKCTIELGVILSDFITNFERVADHCSNVAVCLIQIQAGGYDTHEYLHLLRQSEDETYKENVMKYAQKYTLP